VEGEEAFAEGRKNERIELFEDEGEDFVGESF
jgi:hypothetical protein